MENRYGGFKKPRQIRDPRTLNLGNAANRVRGDRICQLQAAPAVRILSSPSTVDRTYARCSQPMISGAIDTTAAREWDLDR